MSLSISERIPPFSQLSAVKTTSTNPAQEMCYQVMRITAISLGVLAASCAAAALLSYYGATPASIPETASIASPLAEFPRLQNDAALLIHALEKGALGYSNICPRNEEFFLSSTRLQQSTSIAQLESNLHFSMEKARASLSLSEEEIKKHGSKHGNQMQMERIDQAIDLQGMEIPERKIISNKRVLKFLKQTKPEIFEHWQELKKLYASHQGTVPFLQTKEAKKHLNTIQELIKEAFSQDTNQNNLANISEWIQETLTGKNNRNLLKGVAEWLHQRQEAGDCLMIRSTGAEDLKQVSNAGGNESPPYIHPSQQDVMQAAGKVIASYFGESSLQNRINAGTNPFEEELQLAVIAQVLIGERIGGEKNLKAIPTSFVLFTNEPLYIGDEKFRVMRISASYGHGEGVVNSQGIATDTAFLLRSEVNPDQLYILYNNQEKLERLAPIEQDGKFVLTKLANPKQLVSRPSLTERHLAQIYRSGLVMESFHQEPRDIEGVVKGDTVYFVQNRSVNRKPMLPTFLKDKTGSIDQVQTKSLVVGKASVITISNKDEILFAQTLKEAEEIAKKREAGSYRLIIVGSPEPANSHPVTNFSYLQIPCLYAPNLQAAKDLIEKIDARFQVVVCTQTASMHLWDSKKANLQESIKEGFGVHPANIAISLPLQNSPPSSADSSQDLDALLIKLRESLNPEESSKTLAQISAKTQGMLKNEIARIETFMKHKTFAPQVDAKLQILHALDAKIGEVLGETAARIANPKGRLERLFHIKTLEAILTGSNVGIGQYSFAQAKAVIQSLERLIAYQNDLPCMSRCTDLLLMGDQTLALETFENWQDFLKKLEMSLEQKVVSEKQFREFQQIISIFSKAEAMPQFISLLPKDSNPTQLVADTIAHFNATDLEFMTNLNQMISSIKQQERSISSFSDPKTYDAAWDALKQLTIQVSSKEWLSSVQNASSFAKLIAYNVMRNALTLLDDSLKTMKKSDLFPVSEHATLFKEMLKPYFQLMENWARIVPFKYIGMNARGIDPDESPALGHFRNREIQLNDYIKSMQDIFQRLHPDTPGSLLPSAKFNVKTSILSGGERFTRPQTLEDMQTLLHQNSINWIASLYEDALERTDLAQSMFPTPFKEALHIMETDVSFAPSQFKYADSTIWLHKMRRVGVNIDKETITAYYNIPIKHHSGRIELVYDIHSSKLLFRGYFLGESSVRCNLIGVIPQILINAGIFKAEQPVSADSQAMSFSVEVEPKNLPALLKDYKEMIGWGGGTEPHDIYRQFLERWAGSHPEIFDVVLPSIHTICRSNAQKGFALELFLRTGILPDPIADKLRLEAKKFPYPGDY